MRSRTYQTKTTIPGDLRAVQGLCGNGDRFGCSALLVDHNIRIRLVHAIGYPYHITGSSFADGRLKFGKGVHGDVCSVQLQGR